MARFGKTIKLIENMYEKVMGDNERYRLKNGARYVSAKRDGVLVYEMLLTSDRSRLILQHYGTPTLSYHIPTGFIQEYYGESVSDRDSMNTLLDCLGYDSSYYFRFGPTVGFYLDGPENEETSKFDEVEFIISYEQGLLSENEIIEGFQYLIDSGTAWSLQGSYTRQAKRLIEQGLCREAN